jgi:hypothetical protein
MYHVHERHLLQQVVSNYKLIETVTLPIAIGNCHHSRIRVIGNVVDSITEKNPQKTITITFYNEIQKIQIYS